MANKKISQQKNNITVLNDDVWIRAIEDQSGTPTDGYIKASQFAKADQINDVDGDTFIKVGTGNKVDIKSGLSTGHLITFKKLDDTEVFQLDEIGNIYNDGNFQLVRKDTSSLFVGTSSSHAGINNVINSVYVGYLSGNAVTTGDDNTAVGTRSLYTNTLGAKNVAIGAYAGYLGSAKSFNTYVGAFAGYRHTQHSSIFIGSYAGQWHTSESDIYILDNQNRGSKNGEKANVMMYGIFDPDMYEQILKVNGVFMVGTFTTTDRNLITPEARMIIFNSTTGKFQGYTGAGWVDFH